MDSKTFINKMQAAGDAYVYYKSPVSGKVKYHICTLDLDNEYIQGKLAKKNTVSKARESQHKAFCWDLDDFKNIDVAQVTQVVPLSTVLNNG